MEFIVPSRVKKTKNTVHFCTWDIREQKISRNIKEMNMLSLVKVLGKDFVCVIWCTVYTLRSWIKDFKKVNYHYEPKSTLLPVFWLFVALAHRAQQLTSSTEKYIHFVKKHSYFRNKILPFSKLLIYALAKSLIVKENLLFLYL